MARFEFRLQGLLKLRKHFENAAQQDLAESQRRFVQAEQELLGLAQQRDAAADLVRGRATDSLTALQSAYAHIHLLGDQEEQSRQRLAVIDAEHTERRQVAVDALRSRRVVEQLRERHLLRHTKELQREDALLTDETGTQVAVRQSEARKLSSDGGA